MTHDKNNCIDTCNRIAEITYSSFHPTKLSEANYNELFNDISNAVISTAIFNKNKLNSKFPVFKIATKKIDKLISKKVVDFYILDYHLPNIKDIKSSFCAIYILQSKNTKEKEFEKYQQNLKQLYEPSSKKEININTLILDTNKIITLTKNYSPVIIYTDSTIKKRKNIKAGELYINLNFKKGLTSACIDKKGFKEYIKCIYDFFDKENNIDLSGFVNTKIIEELTSRPKASLNNINFLNTKAAFITYTFFLEKIFPFEGISEFIYFPAVSTKMKKEHIHHEWIGGIFFAFKKQTTFAERIVIRGFTQRVVNTIYQQYQLLKIKSQEDNILRHARKSAFAEVNARTLSHNTGSHIMTNKLYDESQENIEQFHNYLRQRMVFNSDITSGITSFESEYSLMDILDEFGNLEIVKKFVSGYKDKHFLDFNMDMNDIKVSIPNGVLGIQALYVIFENIIRNYFKHVGTYSELKINVIIKKDTDNHLCLMLSDDSEPNIETLRNIQDLINLPILDEDNKLRSAGFGLLEMKGAACYINKIPIDQIDNPTINIETTKNGIINLQKAIAFGAEKNDNKLWFYIWLRKPKNLLLLSDDDTANKNELAIKGINKQKEIINKNYPHQWVVKKQSHASTTNNIIPSLSPRYLQFKSIDFLLDTKLGINKMIYPYWISLLCKWKEIDATLKIFINDCDEPKFCFNNGNDKNIFKIVFDIHGSNYYKCSTADYYEPYRSPPNPAGTILNNLSQYPDIEYELFETVLTEVGIIDERIQRISLEEDILENNSQKSNPLKIDILKKMRIYIPNDESDVNLNESEHAHKTLNDIKTWIKKTSMNFLIIHLSLIEKLMDVNMIKGKEEINIWLNNNIFSCFNKSNLVPHIIITTERGTPDKIPDNCRFLHYSNIVKYLLEDRSKFHFVKSLYNSRKTELL